MAQVLNSVKSFPGKMFTWHYGTGVTGASDLGHGFHSRIWQDSADSGFFVVSHRTGKKKLFFLDRIENDVDGEPVAAVFISEDGVVIRVYND